MQLTDTAISWHSDFARGQPRPLFKLQGRHLEYEDGKINLSLFDKINRLSSERTTDWAKTAAFDQHAMHLVSVWTRRPTLCLWELEINKTMSFRYFEGLFCRQKNKSQFSISNLQLVVLMNNKHVNTLTGAVALHTLTKSNVYYFAYIKVTVFIRCRYKSTVAYTIALQTSRSIVINYSSCISSSTHHTE